MTLMFHSTRAPLTDALDASLRAVVRAHTARLETTTVAIARRTNSTQDAAHKRLLTLCKAGYLDRHDRADGWMCFTPTRRGYRAVGQRQPIWEAEDASL